MKSNQLSEPSVSS